MTFWPSLQAQGGHLAHAGKEHRHAGALCRGDGRLGRRRGDGHNHVHLLLDEPAANLRGLGRVAPRVLIVDFHLAFIAAPLLQAAHKGLPQGVQRGVLLVLHQADFIRLLHLGHLGRGAGGGGQGRAPGWSTPPELRLGIARRCKVVSSVFPPFWDSFRPFPKKQNSRSPFREAAGILFFAMGPRGTRFSYSSAFLIKTHRGAFVKGFGLYSTDWSWYTRGSFSSRVSTSLRRTMPLYPPLSKAA